MKWIRSPGLFVLLVLLGFWVLFFSIWDMIFDKGWTQLILTSYALLVILAVALIFLKSTKPVVREDTIEEFEKTLEGGLYHFKCPTCNGIFAIKRSKHNNKKPVKMTCPDCGEIGIIPSTPKCIEEEIPEKKSVNVDFKCTRCEEGITIWAEGTELYPHIYVYSCPFCGEEKTMNRI